MSTRLVSTCVLSTAFLAFAGCGGGGGTTTGTLSGSVLGSPTPVSGALVTIEELNLQTTTTSQGFFSFDNVPVGSYTVLVDGTQVFDPNDNSQRLPRKAVIEFPTISVGGGTTTLNDRPVFLPTLDEGMEIDTSGTVTGMIPAGTVIRNEDVGVTLVFEQATTVTFKSASDTTVSVSEVPIGEIPMNLPDGQISSSVVTLQPPGATFSPGAKVIFPNWNELPAGTTAVSLYRFDHDAGDWITFGTGTVDAEGATVVSDPDSPLTESGWNGPTTPVACVTTVTGQVVDAASPSTGISGVRVTTINGLWTTTDADGNFSISSVPVPRPGFQILVYAAPVTANSGYKANVSDGDIVVCDGTTEIGAIALDTEAVDETAPSVSTIVPAASATAVSDNAVINVTFSENVSPGSITSSTFSVSFNGTPIAGSIGVNGANVVFVPAEAMPLNGTGTVSISTGVKDAAGNGLATEFSSTFETAGTAGGGAVTVAVGGTASVIQGQTTQLTGTLMDASSATIAGSQFVWSSSDLAVASVTSTGLVTGVGAGTATITATSGSVMGTLVVTVTAPAVNSVVVTPGTQTIATAGLRQFAATARDVGGADIAGASFAWSTSNAAAATVDAAGNVTGVAAGVATITATSNSVMGTAVVTVVDPSTVSSISVVPGAAQADVGATLQFEAIARDGSSNIIPGIPFTWTSSDTAVATISSSLGLATAVANGSSTITATSGSITGTSVLNIAQNTTLTVVLNGGKMATDPMVGVEVLRHNPATGAFIEQVSTNSAGIASFGDIGATSTTFTVVQNFDQQAYGLYTLAGVAAGTYTLTLVPEVTAAATFDVTFNNADMTADAGELVVGNYDEGEGYPALVSGGTATILNVQAKHLQANGKVSLFAAVANTSSGAVTGGGWLLDQDPTAITGMNLPIDVGTAPATIPFTASSAVRADGYILRRSGAMFDVAPFWSGGAAATTGTVAVPNMPGVNAWDMVFSVAETASTSGMYVDQMYYGSLPSAVTVATPDITISSLARDASTQTLTWTVGGADAANVDLAFAELSYVGTINLQRGGGSSVEVEWEILGDFSTASVKVPDLPSNLSTLAPGTTGVGYEVELVDLDNVSGFAAGVERLQSVAGSTAEVPFTANVITSAFKKSSAVSVAVVGSGSVTVVSSPAGIDTSMGQMTANFPGGTALTLTATASGGSTITSIDCPGGVVTGSNPQTCTVTLEEARLDVNVNVVTQARTR